ncbi:integrase core domain-containing protein [Streptomyces sp. NPDC056638]|uniref:integrase core domain-containing protein n=1 Tax=Streptomyces sp. NPDC056638 TaxID=3345887 RepID=UPI0036980C61
MLAAKEAGNLLSAGEQRKVDEWVERLIDPAEEQDAVEKASPTVKPQQDKITILAKVPAHLASTTNALVESLWQGLKRETMHKKLFTTMSQARLEIFQWLTYYNARRRHSALSYLSPMEFEQQHHKTAKLSLAA